MAEAAAIDWRVLRSVALVFFAARLALLVVAQPFMDETYYWMWGQHLALSYFDHPSLIGWTQGVASWFGWNAVALRLPVFLTLVGDLVLLALIVRRTVGEAWRDTFWLIAAVFLSTPIFVLLTGSALPDHLLMFLTLLTIYAVERFGRGIEGDEPRWRWLYLAGVAIGLATLAKYTGALLGGALALYVLAAPRLRQTLRSPHPYLAALVALLMQAPVLIWNAQHEFASFGFIVGGRSGLHQPLSFGGLSGYLLGAVAVLGPFLLWSLLRFAIGRGDGHGYSRIVFWVSSTAFLVASLFTNILIHWNAIAYAAALPFAAQWFRPRWMVVAQLVFGAATIGVAFVNFALLPMTALVGPADQTSGWSYGWNEVAAAVLELRQAEPTGFIAGTSYALASPLAFAMRDASVMSLSSARDAYDDWFDGKAHHGQSALIVADRFRPVTKGIAGQFASLKPVRTVKISRFGRLIDTYTIYVGEGYRPH